MFKRFWRSRRGAVMVEFAAAMPVFAIMLLAGVEVSRLALLHQKMDRLATTMADLVAQGETISATELNTFYTAATPLMWPYGFTNKGRIIVSAVNGTTGTPRVSWQHSGGGSISAASKIGVSGGNASLPSGFVVRTDESLITTEIYFDFEPAFFPAVAPARRLYHRSFYRPRLGTLTTLG